MGKLRNESRERRRLISVVADKVGRGYKRASDEEIVAAYRSTGSVWKAAKQLGLVGQSVHERLHRLGIKPVQAKWTDEEDDELRALFTDPYLTIHDVSKRLNRTSASLSCRANELGIKKIRAPKHKRIPRGKGYDKASIKKHIKQFESSDTDSITKYCRRNRLHIETFAHAAQRHFPIWWAELARQSGLKKRRCPYCNEEFYPSNARQEFCTRKCSSDSARDKREFGGNRRNGLGIIERVCQICFKDIGDGKVHAHHVYGRSRDPDNEYLVALCSRCHMALEQLAAHADFDSDAQWIRFMRFVWMKREGWKEENVGRELKVVLFRSVTDV